MDNNPEWDETLSELADPIRNGHGRWDDLFEASKLRGIPPQYVADFIEFERDYPEG